MKLSCLLRTAFNSGCGGLEKEERLEPEAWEQDQKMYKTEKQWCCSASGKMKIDKTLGLLSTDFLDRRVSLWAAKAKRQNKRARTPKYSDFSSFSYIGVAYVKVKVNLTGVGRVAGDTYYVHARRARRGGRL